MFGISTMFHYEVGVSKLLMFAPILREMTLFDEYLGCFSDGMK